MARLTREEKAVGAGAGLLLGALIGLADQWLHLGLPAGIALCVVFAAGLGAALAQRKGGPR